MAVPIIFKTIEESGISSWIRDSPSIFAYWFILSLHAVGMGLLVGASVVIDLRLLGVAKDLPLSPLKGLYRIIWVGFWIQIVSGALLLIAYPTKALTNPDFYIKLTLIGIAVTMMMSIKKRVFADTTLSDSDMMLRGKALAVWSLVLWAGAVTAGRLLAYTYNYLKYDYRG
ncbi:MAG TPA: hypothetical protein VKY31_06905 [Terriglobia bacterium]|nr:hypothetical protein [Terriglobia bacterium]